MSLDPIYAARRDQFFDQMPENAVAVFPSAPVRARNNDVDHEFRQDSDLFYLTGFGEPESVAILARSGGERSFQLVVRPRDKEREIWDGKRAGVDGAKSTYGADEAFPVEELAASLEKACGGKSTLIYALGAHGDEDLDDRLPRPWIRVAVEGDGVQGPEEPLTLEEGGSLGEARVGDPAKASQGGPGWARL